SSPDSINLYSTLKKDIKLAVNVLPPFNKIEQKIYIQLNYKLPKDGNYTFSWSKIDQLPAQLNVYLVDHQSDTKMDLRARNKYSFNYLVPAKKNTLKLDEKKYSPKGISVEGKSRFSILLTVDEMKKYDEPMKKPVTLAPNFPNPFREQTTIKFKLKEPGPVTLTVWNIIGRKVDTICKKQPLTAGNQIKIWNANNNLPSGIYILKLEAAGKVLT